MKTLSRQGPNPLSQSGFNQTCHVRDVDPLKRFNYRESMTIVVDPEGAFWG